MHFLDPHIHIASRTTDDLQALARAGCLVVGEPAFWMGYWAGITLYPTTKATPERAVDLVEMYGPERILVNS
jgi:predicted metal-dependent TIM-barrel fold hydrolase